MLTEGRCSRSLGAATAITTPRHQNPQPGHEPHTPSPLQAPVTLEPDSSVERKIYRGDREGTLKTAKLQKLNP